MESLYEPRDPSLSLLACAIILLKDFLSILQNVERI